MLSINTFARVVVNTVRASASPNRIALGTLTITDNVSGFKTVYTGVNLQKSPDRTYDRTATNLTYTLLATTITEQQIREDLADPPGQ